MFFPEEEDSDPKKIKNRSWTSSSSFFSFSFSMVPAMAILSSLPIFVFLAYHASIFVLFDLFPTLWNFYYPLFTPTNLFFLVNIIIFALFAISHAQQQQHSHTSTAPPSSPQPQVSLSNPTDLRRLDSSLEENLQVLDAHQDSQKFPLYDDSSLEENVHVLDAHQDSQKFSLYEGPDVASAPQKDEAVVVEDRLQQHEQNGVEILGTRQHDDGLLRYGHGEDDDPTNPFSSSLSESSRSILAAIEMSELKERMEKPLPSVRFASRAKGTAMAMAMAAAGEQGRSGSPLRISRPSMKRGETMEATWRAICETKERSTTNNVQQKQKQKQKNSPSAMKTKSRLRREGSSADALAMVALSPNKAVVKIKREPSMRADELNERIEAFISRFHEQIRIQRQESLLDSYAGGGGGA